MHFAWMANQRGRGKVGSRDRLVDFPRSILSFVVSPPLTSSPSPIFYRSTKETIVLSATSTPQNSKRSNSPRTMKGGNRENVYKKKKIRKRSDETFPPWIGCDTMGVGSNNATTEHATVLPASRRMTGGSVGKVANDDYNRYHRWPPIILTRGVMQSSLPVRQWNTWTIQLSSLSLDFPWNDVWQTSPRKFDSITEDGRWWTMIRWIKKEISKSRWLLMRRL